MKLKSVFIASSILIAFIAFIFVFVPNAVDVLSFSGLSFFSGELWRLFTFSFTHVNLQHLLENIISIFLVAFLGYEFGLNGKSFFFFFIVASFIVALVDAFLLPSLVLAGASLGIYGIVGALSIKGSNFIPKLYLIPLLGLSVFVKYLLVAFIYPSSFELEQTFFHFSGFLTGILLFYVPRTFKKKRYILQR